MSDITATPATFDRDAALASLAKSFTVSTSVKVTRSALILSLVDDGMTEPQVAAALGRLIPGSAPSRATVGFYVRAGRLTLDPIAYGAAWTAVTRGEGVTFDQAAAVVTDDPKATAKALTGLVREAKAAKVAAKAAADQAKADEREAAKAETIGNERAAEAGAMAAPAVSAPDFAALLAPIVAKARTTEARQRLAKALVAAMEEINAAERAAKVAKAA